MTEAKTDHAETVTAGGRVASTTVLLFLVIVGFMVFAGIGEHLRPEEAKFLNQVIDSQPDQGVAVTLQSMWADFCGLMERPARLLGLLCGAGGLLLLLATVRRRQGSTTLAIAGAGALGLVLSESILIGGSAPAFFAVAAGTFLLQRLFGLPLRALAFLSVIVAAAVQLGMGLVEVPAESAEAWLRFGPDLAWWGLPLWSGTALVALLFAIAFLSAQEPDGFLLVGFACSVPFITDTFGLSMGPVSSVIAAYTVPLCLWLSVPRSKPAWSRNILVACLLVTVAVIGTETARKQNTPDGRKDREALDWVASSMPSTAWVALDGERRQVLRYFEYCGHRTGHRSILIRNEADLARLVQVALYEKPPRICFFGVDKNAIKGLKERYVLAPVDGQPDGLIVATFKRRS